MAYRSFIRMLPKNSPSLNPLVKSPWTLNNPFKSGRPSTSTEKRRKLPKEGGKAKKMACKEAIKLQRIKAGQKSREP